MLLMSFRLIPSVLAILAGRIPWRTSSGMMNIATGVHPRSQDAHYPGQLGARRRGARLRRRLSEPSGNKQAVERGAGAMTVDDRRGQPAASAPATAPRNLTLLMVEGTYALCRLAADAPDPAWAAGGRFTSITRTGD